MFRKIGLRSEADKSGIAAVAAVFGPSIKRSARLVALPTDLISRFEGSRPE
jgi:hypothetical protein